MSRTIYIFAIVLMMAFAEVGRADELKISKDFNVFTSKNAQGYLKPLFTTISESFNTGLYTGANYKKGWSISLDLGIMGMIIPESQKKYQAELPEDFGNSQITQTSHLVGGKLFQNQSGSIEQPTLYGGVSTPVFSAPQHSGFPDSLNRTIAFMEGNDINMMSGIPVLYLSIGIPTRTQFKTRFFKGNISNDDLTYYSLAINQNIDKLFDLFADEDNMALALNFAIHSLEYPGLSMNSWSLGSHISKTFDFGLTLYGGIQYEDLSGQFKAMRDLESGEPKTKSAYKEIREQQPIQFDMETFTNYRALIGASYRTGIFEFHGDIALATQPVLKAGISLWFLDQEYKEVEYEGLPLRFILPEPPIVRNIPRYAGLINYKADAFRELPPDKPEPILTAGVEHLGLADNIEIKTDKIVIEEFLSRQMRPLLPYIFFKDSSATIEDKYIKYTSDNKQEFKENKLLGLNNIETYYQILNIIGKRLIEKPEAKITLGGYLAGKGAEKNKINIAKQRAEAVKDYYVNVWGIDESRIKIKTGKKPPVASNEATNQGVEENRRVEISSDDLSILAPLNINDTLRNVKPSGLRFKTDINSEKPVTQWSMNIKADNEEIRELKGLNAPEKNLDVFIEEYVNKLRIAESVKYKLTVTNSENKTISTEEKEIPVEVISVARKRELAAKDTIKNVYNLILFEFNKSKLDPINKQISDIIRSEIPDNAIVSIIGYTDMMGDEKHNQKLSEARAKSTANSIKAENMQSKGVGEYELLFNNDLPEGRFLCRTVVVEVKIPVNN